MGTIAMPLLGCRILVVEDEALVGMMTLDELTEVGAEIVGPASSVEEALAILEDGSRLDAAVLDLNLRGETSEAVAAALVKRGVPYVVATGYGPGVLPQVDQGCAALLTKPYEQTELVAKLAALCGAAD